MIFPGVVYIGKTKWSDNDWSENNIFDSPAYINENAVRDLLREEYKMMNNIFRQVSLVGEDLIVVEKSIDEAIIRMKTKIMDKQEGGDK